MKSILKLEELAMLAVSVYALFLLQSPWWCYLLMALGPELETAGIILFGHSSMDRIFGYGLKLNEGFKFTHLGLVGNK
jgi:hypothetical protein